MDDRSKIVYEPPQLETFGTFRELTQVGITNPGGDALPGNAQGQDGGSVFPGGLNR